MIRYPILKDLAAGHEAELIELERLLEEHHPGWLEKASQAATEMVKAKKFEDGTPIWRKIKPVYLLLQLRKCAYCERPMRDSVDDDGSVEQDVEHFRTKKGVKKWPPAGSLQYNFNTGAEFPQGYYTLAYHPFNYCVACKTCNSILKANFFPIEGDRKTIPGDSPKDYLEEKPLLIYPLGTLDDDPEDHLEFCGMVPFPKSNRGRVTIDLFNLEKASTLLRERAKEIHHFYCCLKDDDAEMIAAMLDDCGAYANCIRSFYRVWLADRKQAEDIHSIAREYIISKEGR